MTDRSPHPAAPPDRLEALLAALAEAAPSDAVRVVVEGVRAAADGAPVLLLAPDAERGALAVLAASDDAPVLEPPTVLAFGHPAIVALRALAAVVSEGAALHGDARAATSGGDAGPWVLVPLPRLRSADALPALALSDAATCLDPRARLVTVPPAERRRRAGLSPFAVALVALGARAATLADAAQVASALLPIGTLAGPMLAERLDALEASPGGAVRTASGGGGAAGAGPTRDAGVVARAKREFLGAVSHELRTPVHAILGYASLLLDEVYGALDPRHREKVARIRASAEQLHGLVGHLLEIARLESARVPVRLEPTPLAPLLREASAAAASAAPAKGVRFALVLEDEALAARTDGARLVQALVALLANAVKFTDAGEIALRAARDGARVRIEVADTGVGIAPEAQGAVWEDFAQADASRARAHDGAGLGLGIVRRIAEKLGAELRLASAPGVGTTVTLWLPSAETPAAPAVPAPALVPAARRDGVRA